GILGESGSGKSSLALSLLRLLPGNARITSGKIQYGRRNLLLLDREELRRIRGAEIALIFQEPALALNPVLPIGVQIGDVLRAHRRVNKAQAVDETYAMLGEVGFSEPERIARACPHQLSGGQQQRVAIAQALICKPRLLIADEPLSSLDTVTQAEILELLQRLKKELDLAMLFITHNAGLLASLAGRIVVMRQGQIAASGTQRELEQMADPYVQEIISPAKVLSSPVPITVREETPLLQVRNLSKQFQQRRIFSRKKFTVCALENIDFALFAGATVALVGRSGSGKSTLAKCIARFETADSGEILLEGVPVQKLTGPSRQQVQLLFQDTATSFNPRFTAEQLISEPLDILQSNTRAERQQKVVQAMQEVGLDADTKNRRAAEFSGGQRQRLALARALVVQPKLLILDEALSGLDIPLQANIVRLLLDLQQQRNLAYLYISHDLNFVSLFAQHILVVHEGRIVEQIVPSKIHESTNPETLALLEASRTVHVPATSLYHSLPRAVILKARSLRLKDPEDA
ncbi:MAG TPA: ABC transporter ATP-binding protein, partial [Candidatus Angelobacter sp.]|nr:ABC transporter ATP-binding protein [Candidatus Angelobacter sp.]